MGNPQLQLQNCNAKITMRTILLLLSAQYVPVPNYTPLKPDFMGIVSILLSCSMSGTADIIFKYNMAFTICTKLNEIVHESKSH